MPPNDKTYRFNMYSMLPNGEDAETPIEVRRSDYPLTRIEELLLMAALVQGKGYTSDLFRAGTGKIIKQALHFSGMTLEALNDVWGIAADFTNPTRTIVDDYLEALIQVTDADNCKHKRYQYALFQGKGNWCDPDGRPNAFPDFTSCRLSYLGEAIAMDLLEEQPAMVLLKMNHSRITTPVVTMRYGDQFAFDNPDDELTIGMLITDLRTELFDEPDEEHTQVSVCNQHWSVTAQVSGLITFDNIDLLEGKESDLPEQMYLRDIPDEELIRIWQAIIRGDRDALLKHSWKPLNELQPYNRDFYQEGTYPSRL
ncbi:MAG: hypothetical protein QM703_27830 [Gemmatales bacterium]